MRGLTWGKIFLVATLTFGVLAGCAGTEGTITGTRQYTRGYVDFTDKPRLDPNSPTFWLDYMNSQGGG